jgi:hypothetical protein
MRIACLQYAPTMGDLAGNIRRADSILRRVAPQSLDLLVLPELAFTGEHLFFTSGAQSLSLNTITGNNDRIQVSSDLIWLRLSILPLDFITVFSVDGLQAITSHHS